MIIEFFTIKIGEVISPTYLSRCDIPANLVHTRCSNQENNHADHGDIDDGPCTITDESFQVAHGCILGWGDVSNYMNITAVSILSSSQTYAHNGNNHQKWIGP